MPPPVLTDRTRIETYQTCPMLRFLKFHWKGMGLVPEGENYETVYGRLHHRVIADVLAGGDPEMAIAGAAADLLAAMPPPFDDPPPPPDLWRAEQAWLFQTLLWVWVLEKLPRLLEEFDVVEAEKEFPWRIGDLFIPGSEGPRVTKLIQMMRLDLLLRQKSTRSLYYKEFKTTGWGDSRWAAQFEHNAQVISGLKAIEETRDLRPVGVLIEAHVKGHRERDRAKNSATSGCIIQTTPLCYVWELEPKVWYPKWPNGGVKRPAWELMVEGGARGYVEQLRRGFPEIIDQIIQQLPPLDPDPFHVERWRRQTILQEGVIAEAIRELALPGQTPEAQDAILDRVFPLHETSCIRFGRKCSHYQVCHGFIREGSFVPRIPHHDLERDGGDPEAGLPGTAQEVPREPDDPAGAPQS